ncbi:GNAT family N-acetyltransferase [Vibrio ishigakensis]|uniref:GNAT family N-acetyltransferase n=1 Tax=Vibrio ishigakensis TaxID=1481914 RepID=UPI0021C35D10|nr:GNAT family N-acetyltransferase [Vibrio ishigakensis]
MDKINYVVTDTPSDEDIACVRSGIKEHNTPFLKGLFHQDLACFAKDETGAVVGGLVSEIWGSWLEIKFLWVSPKTKGQGVGSEILKRAEEQAKSLGCHSSLLDTFNFQAKPFYEKHGYRVQMTLYDHPVSTERYYMVKELG